MKIAFLVDGFPRLSETFILNQIAGLLDRGHDVRIFTSALEQESELHPEFAAYNLYDRATAFGVHDRIIPRFFHTLKLFMYNVGSDIRPVLKSLNAFRYGRNAASLRLIHWLVPFIGQNYDILHCHFGTNGIKGICLRSLGVPGKIITSFHGYDISEIPRHYGSGIYNSLFSGGDLLTVNSRFTLENVLRLGCPAEKTVILPMGIDLRLYRFREGIYVPGETLNLISVARLVEKKGLRYAIEAVAILRKKMPDIRYRIIGDGPLRGELERLVRDHGLDDAVKLLGPRKQDEIRKLYAESHICIVPSITDSRGDQEGQGVVLQEAQATGLPVVASRHNGFPEGMIEGESGFLVPEKDSNAIAERIEFICSNPGRWSSMSRAGREFIEEKYDQSKLTDTLERIYIALVREEPGILDELRHDSGNGG